MGNVQNIQLFFKFSVCALLKSPIPPKAKKKKLEVTSLVLAIPDDLLKGLCHRYRYMNGWYGNVYDKVPTLSISIQIAPTKNMRLYCDQQRGTSNPVSCNIAPLTNLLTTRGASAEAVLALAKREPFDTFRWHELQITCPPLSVATTAESSARYGQGA